MGIMKSKSLDKEEKEPQDQALKKEKPLNILPRSPKAKAGLSIGKTAFANLSPSKELEQTILLSVEDMDNVSKSSRDLKIDPTRSTIQKPKKEIANSYLETDEFAVPEINEEEEIETLIPESSEEFKKIVADSAEDQSNPFDSQEKEKLSSVHTKNTKQPPTKFFIKLIAASACIFIAFLIIGLSKITYTKTKPIQSSEQLAASTSEAVIESPTQLALERAQNNLSKSIRIAEQFLKAETPQELLKFCRDSQRIETALIKYYQSNPLNHNNFELDPEKFDIVQFGVGTATLHTANQPNGKSRPLCLVHSDSDNPLVDWESFVNLCEIPWSDLKAQRPTSSVMMRAKLKPASYYNFSYTEDKWECYRMSDMNDQHFLYVYVERGSESDLKIQAQLGLDSDLSEKRSMTSAITKIFFEDGAGKHQARLDEILNFGTLLH